MNFRAYFVQNIPSNVNFIALLGMLEYLRDAVKWGTDYFIKAHVSPNEFYGQVGDGFKDHASWGR